MKKSLIFVANKKIKFIIKTDFEFKKEKKKKRCNYSRLFFFLLEYVIAIRFVFWKIVSEHISNRVFEKTKPIIRQILNFKTNLVRKNFSVKKVFKLKQWEIIRVSKIIQYNFIKLLRICGSIFFINIFPYFKVFTSRFFGHNFYKNNCSSQGKLGDFIKINFFYKFHFLKTDLFLKINSKLLIIADVWLVCNLYSRSYPWWRKFRIRECELEYVCETVVNSVCSTSRKR
jgi:hypothetical protein